MLSEEEVRSALEGWRAALGAMKLLGDKQGYALADGYVGALEMVLRG